MKRVLICTVVVLSAVASAQTRTVELTLHPSKAAAPAQEYRLIPKADKLTEADAVPLYEQAAQSLPKKLDMNQFRQWLKTPLDTLPREKVRSTLNKLGPTLRLIEQAVKRKPLSWPQFQQGAMPPNLSEYRNIGCILAVQARLQIAQGRHEQAIGTMQKGFAMAKHVGESPTVTQGMTGVVIATFMCRQLEQLIQGPDAPSIYGALQKLPRPLVDLNVPMTIEMSNLESNRQYNIIVRRALKRHLESSHAAVRLMMTKLDRHVAALRCVEAMRLYAGAHEGKFPDKLTDITEVDIPVDPVNKKPFTYDRRGTQVFLEAAAPKGATARDAMQYLLNLKE